MKKKAPNLLIKLQVSVQNTNKVFGFRVGIHTFIKEVENLIADEMGLDLLRTSLELTHPNQPYRLNSSKTLAQYRITNKIEYIYCRFLNINGTKLAQVDTEIKAPINQKLGTLDMTYKFPVKQGGVVKGLNIECVCVNKKCINYNRGIVYPLGMGEFNLLELLKGFRCNVCPYRDMNIFTPALTKQIKFKNCMFNVKGQIVKNKFPSLHDIGCWVLVDEEDSTFLQRIIESHDWIETTLTVKNIKPEGLNPFAEYM